MASSRTRLTLNGGAALRATREGAVRGLWEAGERVMIEANKVIPIESGELERSSRVSVDPARLRAAVSYAGPYAVIQHERMDLHHDAGRMAKWLERTLTGEAGTVGGIIAAALRESLNE